MLHHATAVTAVHILLVIIAAATCAEPSALALGMAAPGVYGAADDAAADAAAAVVHNTLVIGVGNNKHGDAGDPDRKKEEGVDRGAQAEADGGYEGTVAAAAAMMHADKKLEPSKTGDDQRSSKTGTSSSSSSDSNNESSNNKNNNKAVFSGSEGTVLIVCQGGPRTSTVMMMLSEGLAQAGIHTNDVYDADGLKHRWFGAEMEVIRRNGLAHGPVRAAVYIHDDPEFIMAELIERGWLYSVAQRTRASVALIGSPVYNVLRNERVTLAEAAAVMTDVLELEEHFDSWVEGACGSPGFPVMFVKAATAWRYLRDISIFLQVSPAYLPTKEALRAEVESIAVPDIATDTLEKLQATYLSLRTKQDQNGDLMVIDGACTPRQEVLVVSVGGEGTTSFIDMLQRAGVSCNQIWDDDGLKHRWFGAEMASVRRWQRRGHRFNVKAAIYLWDDPVHAAASLIRRGWLWDQAEKTRLIMPQKQTETYKVLTNGEVTMEAIAHAHDDVLDIQGHFFSWLEGAKTADFPVLFLRSSTRWRHVDAVASFLGVSPTAFPEDMRQEHVRKSTKPLRASTAAVMEQLYENLTSVQSTLGEFYVVPQDKASKTIRDSSPQQQSSSGAQGDHPAARIGGRSSSSGPGASDDLVSAQPPRGYYPTDPAVHQEEARVQATDSMHRLLLWSNFVLLALTVTMFGWVCRIYSRSRLANSSAGTQCK